MGGPDFRGRPSKYENAGFRARPMKMNEPSRASGFWSQLRRLKLTCAESARLQSEGLDRELSRLERLGLRLHLLLCAWCRDYGRQIRLIRTALRGFPRSDADLPQDTLSAEARTRIKQTLRH